MPEVEVPAALKNSLPVRLNDPEDPVDHAAFFLDTTLPASVEFAAAQWGVRIVRPLAGGITAAIFEVDGPRGREVLKINPQLDFGEREIDGMLAYNGVGTPRLIGVDRNQGILLMEKVDPGYRLGSFSRAGILLATTELLQQLHNSPVDPAFKFRRIDGRVEQRFDEARKALRVAVMRHAARNDGRRLSYPVPREVLVKVYALAQQLLAADVPSVAGFGDFYPGNILATKNVLVHKNGRPFRQHVGVDAQRYEGDPAFDAGNAAYGLGFMYGIPLSASLPALSQGHEDDSTFEERTRAWCAVIGLTGYAMHCVYGDFWPAEPQFMSSVAKEALGTEIGALVDPVVGQRIIQGRIGIE